MKPPKVKPPETQPTRKFTVLRGVLRAFGRDIVVVKIKGQRQAYYRSSGRNSGQRGEWFPFDGISTGPNMAVVWFNKSHFCNTGSSFQSKGPLWRYGSDELRQIANLLGTRKITEGQIAESIAAVNLFIDTPASRAFNEHYQELFESGHGYVRIQFDIYNAKISREIK